MEGPNTENLWSEHDGRVERGELATVAMEVGLHSRMHPAPDCIDTGGVNTNQHWHSH